MKILHDMLKQIILVLFLFIIQMLCLWAYKIPNEALLYISFMEGSMMLCYFILVWINKQRTLKHLQESDYKTFLAEHMHNYKDEEIQRILQEAVEELHQQKQLYHKEKKEREQYFQLWIHQIKTPIFAMRMLSDHMEDGKHKNQMRSELFKIERYTQMALNYQRLDDDYLFEQCYLHDIVQEALRSYSTLFIEKGLCLDYTYEEDDIIYTDRKWMRFVIEQILDNAIKYTQQGTIHVHCHKAEVLIEDEGCGIASEDLKLILRKGYTGKLGREQKQATGMGLYFVKEICQRLHAELRITSQKQQGTCVSIHPVTKKLLER